MVVVKYGGSSVETIEKMQRIADKIIARKNENIVVVVSAMGKTTNSLIDIAKQVSTNPSKRELDLLMSTGEQVSISLLAMILNEKGCDSIALTGFQAGIKTEGVHTKNKIAEIDISKIKHHLDKGKIVVVAGFQGLNEYGDITTLGRGGSDTTAVALASKLDCVCEIYTDVSGIYTVDPRLYPKAKKLELISYEEMEEMSSLGAKVMEPRAVEIGHLYHVPIYVASSVENIIGTYIKESCFQMEKRSVTGLSINEDVLMVTLNHVPYSSKNIADIFMRLATAEVNVDMISQTSPITGYVNISFTTSKEDITSVNEILLDLKNKYKEMEILKDDSIIKISVVGLGMRSQSGIAANIFKLFADYDIIFKQVTTSEISISYTINKDYKQKAINVIAEYFDL